MSYNIPYHKINFFSSLILDYLNQDNNLTPFINGFPEIENFGKQIREKANHDINRHLLVDVLRSQNVNLALSEKSEQNVNLLLLENTFTITTGHQLCLFTGPLYFIYKIISTINLSEELSLRYPQNNFVPIFWMASEDHDFREINHIHLFGDKIEWDTKQSGAVGRMNLDGLEKIILRLRSILGSSANAERLISMFEESYLNNDNLADATRNLLNELFGKYGLLILDGDNKDLKEQFIPQMKKDILKNSSFLDIEKCSNNLGRDYKIQAYVRKINFFKLEENKRVLLKEGVLEDGIIDTPETFSPNVLMRPLYQEIILPNIAYIGGQAEISYWMQLRDLFKKEKVPFPILCLRNSALLITQKQQHKFEKLGFQLSDLFLSKDELNREYLLRNLEKDISFDNEKQELKLLYHNIGSKTNDIGLTRSIRAQLQKQFSYLDNLKKKFIRIEKKRNQSSINQIIKIKEQLFPANILQERYDSFIPFYLEYGDNFIKILKDNFKSENLNFVVLVLGE